MLRSEPNARFHAAATVAVVLAGALLSISRTEWCLIAFAIVSVWLGEALNTGLEFVCDVVSPERHPLIGKAKDVSAAGVLISATGAVIVGLLVLAPPMVRLLDW